MTEIIDIPSSELEVYDARPPARLFTGSPTDVVAQATETANALAAVVRAKGLIVDIGGREYAKVDAWTLLGTMLGVFPYTVWTRKLEDGTGFEARVEARTLAGGVVGAAEAQCTRSERTWANREDYALRSMAATRATGKAMRMPLGFVLILAGFEATPAEEMPRDEPAPTPAPKQKAAESQFKPPTSPAEAPSAPSDDASIDVTIHGVSRRTEKSPWEIDTNHGVFKTFDTATGDLAAMTGTARIGFKVETREKDGKTFTNQMVTSFLPISPVDNDNDIPF